MSLMAAKTPEAKMDQDGGREGALLCLMKLWGFLPGD